MTSSLTTRALKMTKKRLEIEPLVFYYDKLDKMKSKRYNKNTVE